MLVVLYMLLVAAAIVGVAALGSALVLLIFPRTRTIGFAAIVSAAIGAMVFVATLLLLALIVSGNLQSVTSELFTLWAFAGCAAGALPALAVTGFGKALLGLLRLRQDVAIRSSSLAPDKRE